MQDVADDDDVDKNRAASQHKEISCTNANINAERKALLNLETLKCLLIATGLKLKPILGDVFQLQDG